MKATAKNGKKTISIRGIVCILVGTTCFLVPLIQSQEAYAERKKASGTVTERTELARDHIRSTEYKPPIPVGEMETIFGVYSSDDPEWNNATFFSVWLIENLNFIGHAVVTFEGGDQIFLTVEGKLKALNVHDWSSDHEGWFEGGTGKFKGIKGTWREKIMHVMSGVTTEWEAEYEIK